MGPFIEGICDMVIDNELLSDPFLAKANYNAESSHVTRSGDLFRSCHWSVDLFNDLSNVLFRSSDWSSLESSLV